MDALLSVKELADLLKVPKSWIYQRVCAGTLPFPFLKLEHFVRFREADIENYLQRQLAEGKQSTEERRRLREVL